MIHIISNNNRKVFKPLKDLNLINSFLFDSSMEDPENAKIIAKIIIKRAIGRELNDFIVETQKELKGIEQGIRGIRMDVLVTNIDSNGKIDEVYDIEPNDYYEANLAKRTRYYNSLTDIKLLSTRESFKSLPELISIWILPYDPFGDNRMLYTVKNVVVENNQLVYNDGVTNLFLYTEGTIGGSTELKHLLKHMTHTTSDNATDPDLQQIQSIVDSIKSNKEVGERYMSMEKIIESAKYHGYTWGKEDGIEEGIEKGIRAMIEVLQEDNISLDKIKSKLLSKFDISEADADEYIQKYHK